MKNYPLLEPGQVYHIYNRGNNRENLFLQEINYPFFLSRWHHYMDPVSETYGYALLKNHFHFLVRIKDEKDIDWPLLIKPTRCDQSPLATVSRQISNCFNSYSKAFNKIYGRTGSLFQERYRRKKIDNHTYLLDALLYIHGNPQRHGFVEDFRKYPYTSYRHLCSNGSCKIKDQVWSWFNGKEEFIRYHDIYQKLITEKNFLSEFTVDTE